MRLADGWPKTESCQLKRLRRIPVSMRFQLRDIHPVLGADSCSCRCASLCSHRGSSLCSCHRSCLYSRGRSFGCTDSCHYLGGGKWPDDRDNEQESHNQSANGAFDEPRQQVAVCLLLGVILPEERVGHATGHCKDVRLGSEALFLLEDQ